jgi:hypothetical protein
VWHNIVNRKSVRNARSVAPGISKFKELKEKCSNVRIQVVQTVSGYRSHVTLMLLPPLLLFRSRCNY